MIQLFELKEYKEKELKKIFDVSDSKWEEIAIELIRKNIISYKEKSIQFKYVGIIIVCKFTIFILPKYLMFEKKDNYDIEIKSLLNLFNNFSRPEKLNREIIEDVDLYSEGIENKLISIILLLVEDYLQHDIYYNELANVERDGAGEINWDKTIDEVMPHHIKGNIFYSELITNCVSTDYYHIISKIHRMVIKECIDFINNTGLKYIINSEIELDEKLIDYSLEMESLKYEIEKEIRIQYNDRKKKVLYLILAYLEEKASTSGEKVLLYGTRNFKWVWEEMCSQIFENQFISTPELNKYKKFNISPPTWSIYGYNQAAELIEENTEISMKKNRLTPDIIRVIEFDDKKYILILDAKYYNIRAIEDRNNDLKIIENPGIGDITKQYCYHMALSSYMIKNNITNVINAFLFPTVSKTEVIGNVKLNFMDNMQNSDDKDEQNKIDLIKLNVLEVIHMYCNNECYSGDDLKLLFLRGEETHE